MPTVDDLLAKVSPADRAELERIRNIVRNTVPDAIELVSYGIPSFKYQDKYLFGYYAYKSHLSLYPASEPIEILRDKLAPYKLSKGTIQFTLDNPLPESLIKELLTLRVASISQD
jgi:uncharacterized protein YdhG (YjbR/CyaY superfamily)